MKPAVAPPFLMERLRAAQPEADAPRAPSRAHHTRFRVTPWSLWWRWLTPATALVLAVGVYWRISNPHGGGVVVPGVITAEAAPVDDVQIDRELVSAFDAVTTLPSGEPVRFRCRQWMDEVTLRDEQRGVMIQQRTPRVEVVPVRFETY